MATATLTIQPTSSSDPATWSEVGDSASVSWVRGTDNSGCSEFTSAGSVTTQRERARFAATSWATLFGIPASATVNSIQITAWKEADWNASITTRTVRMRFVDSGSTTVHSAGDLIDTGAGVPTNTTGVPQNMAGGSVRAVDATYQSASTLVRLEIDLAVVTTTSVLDLEQSVIVISIDYTLGGGSYLPLRIANPNVGPMAMRHNFRDVQKPYFASTTTQLILMDLVANSTATVILQNQVNKVLSASAPASTLLQKQVNKVLSAASLASVLLQKTVLKPLTINTTSSTNLQKNVFKALTANSTSTTSLTRTVLKLLQANSTSNTSLQKTVLKTLVANSTATVSLSALRVIVMVLVANATATASLVKQVNKTLSAPSTASAALQKQANKMLSASGPASASLQKQVNKLLKANSTATVTLQSLRVITMLLVANATASVSLNKLVSKPLQVAAPAQAFLTKLVTQTLVVTGVSATASVVVHFISGSVVPAAARARNIVLKRFGIY